MCSVNTFGKGLLKEQSAKLLRSQNEHKGTWKFLFDRNSNLKLPTLKYTKAARAVDALLHLDQEDHNTSFRTLLLCS